MDSRSKTQGKQSQLFCFSTKSSKGHVHLYLQQSQFIPPTQVLNNHMWLVATVWKSSGVNGLTYILGFQSQSKRK